MTGLYAAAGKLWGTIRAILDALPKATRVTAATIHGWIRAGKLTATKVGRALVLALDDVLLVERDTRQTAKRRGGRPRGKTAPATA